MDLSDPKSRTGGAVYRWPRSWFGLARKLPSQAGLPARAIAIWFERPDLQQAFNLLKTSGREKLAWWYLRSGFSELGLRFDKVDDTTLLCINDDAPHMPQLSFLPISWLMRGLVTRAPVKRKQLCSEPKEQQKLLDWYFARGLAEANLLSFLSERQASELLEEHPNHPGIPRLLTSLWFADPTFQTRFASVDDPTYRRWCVRDGARDFPILAHPLIALARPPERRSHTLKPFGVNVVGHGHARSGVSEDARAAIRALNEVGIPAVLHNISPGPEMPEEEHGPSEQALPYAINMFAMPAPSMVAAISKIGENNLIDHYNIGFWPWELPDFPAFWHHAFDLVDEVWASSRFAYSAFVRSSSKVVRQMPFAVSVENSDGLDRKKFGLPLGKFLFGFAFDGLSSFNRKAPLGAIKAFRQAFPTNDQSVALVIKGLRVSRHPDWKSVQDAVSEDSRIHLITDSLSRGALLDLLRSLDCFISLHRSEGFGRNIAEAMLLGKPAIVTGYSGNMDFTTDETAALVSFTPRLLKRGDYPYGSGQVWAEPNIYEAASLMRQMVVDKQWRDQRAAAATKVISDRYSPQIVGRQWRTALRQIYP